MMLLFCAEWVVTCTKQFKVFTPVRKRSFENIKQRRNAPFLTMISIMSETFGSLFDTFLTIKGATHTARAGSIKMFLRELCPFLRLAYSCHFVCLSVLPSVCPKLFLHNCLTKLDKTSYINSLRYCSDVFFPFFSI